MSYIGKAPAESALTAGDITDGIVTTVKLADDAVTAAKVADGIIVNAAVSSTAAIDDTKISPPYYVAVANFPTASDHHGRVAHAHSEGALYYSHGGSWVQLADNADLPTNPALLAADQTFTAANRGTITVDNDGSFDLAVTNNFKCTPSGNFALTFTNFADGQSGYILLINSGGHTVSLHANSKADANLATTVTSAGTYLISYVSDGTNAYLTNSAVFA